MEAIRQNGKIILHSDDGTGMKMIFKNLTGKNFQGREYVENIKSIDPLLYSKLTHQKNIRIK